VFGVICPSAFPFITFRPPSAMPLPSLAMFRQADLDRSARLATLQDALRESALAAGELVDDSDAVAAETAERDAETVERLAARPQLLAALERLLVVHQTAAGMPLVRAWDAERGEPYFGWDAGARCAVAYLDDAGYGMIACLEEGRYTRGMGLGLTDDSVLERLAAVRAFCLKVPDPLPASPEAWTAHAGAPVVFMLTSCAVWVPPAARPAATSGGRSRARRGPEVRPPSGLVRARTVGVFDDLAVVHDVLQENRGDLEEAGYYPHAVVEALPLDGGAGPLVGRLWYAFDRDYDGYRPCSEPAGVVPEGPLGGVVGFAAPESLPSSARWAALAASVPPDAAPSSREDGAAAEEGDVEGRDDDADRQAVPTAYLVSTLPVCHEDDRWPAATRSVALVRDPMAAAALLWHNVGDLAQGGAHAWALIERVRIGHLYGVDHGAWWYAFDPALGGFRPMEVPSVFERTFGIGGIG
jgi:hypothetical protein